MPRAEAGYGHIPRLCSKLLNCDHRPMNRYERQTEQTRRASLRNAMLLWSAGGILLVGILALLGYSSGAPQRFWTWAGIGVAVLLLVIRQVGRRLKSGGSRAAKPDERSMLHLE
jgi:hypothetical protein